MAIAVTTPTGHVGSHVVRLLIQAGVRPRLLVRDANTLDSAVRERAEVVSGVDQRDADAVVEATRGVNSLFWVDPHTGEGDPVEEYAREGANAARAVTENGIARTVFLSSIGAEKRAGAGEIDGLARTEQALNETGANVLILRCGYFFTNLLQQVDELRAGSLSTTWPVDYSMAWVAPRDIGEVAAARLLHNGWTGQHVQAVHGPEDLTFPRVAEVISQVVGQQITVQPISFDQLRATLRSVGLASPQIEGIVGMSAGLSENFTPENPRDVVTTTPTTLAAWAQEHLRPLFG